MRKDDKIDGPIYEFLYLDGSVPWELRVGKLRVFYEVMPGEPSLVRILGVGRKDRSILRIAGREITL